MDDYRALAVFAAVVRLGSLSAAARQLRLSTSAVSQQLRALEQLHGVTLLHRSTRKLALTDAGARVFAECAAMVEAAERAQQQLRASREQPSGELRLAAPVGFGPHIAPALTPLLAAHPALTLRLFVDDAMIDLIDARIDLAIRVGRLPDSNWVARRLCALGLLLCAAPAYLHHRGTPRTPEELRNHDWLSQSRSGAAALMLGLQHADGERRDLRVEPRVASNNQLLLQQMCVAGLGIALLGSADAHADLQSGRLVELLPDWRTPPLEVWAATPQRDAQPAKVRFALAALGDYLRALPGMYP